MLKRHVKDDFVVNVFDTGKVKATVTGGECYPAGGMFERKFKDSFCDGGCANRAGSVVNG